VANDFAADAVLLRSEGERHKGDAVKVVEVAGQWIDADVPDEELGVAEAEGVALCGAAVLAWAQEPEVGDVAEVGNCCADVVVAEA